MSLNLCHEINRDGVLWCVDPASGISEPARWPGAVDGGSEEARTVSTLMGLLESERAYPDETGGLLVPHEVIASLDETDVAQLELPLPAPWTLRMEGSGGLADRGLFVMTTFLWTGPPNRPVVGASRVGAFASVGKATYTLLEPLFSILNAADRLNAMSGDPEVRQEDRLLEVGRLQRLLPDDAVQEGSIGLFEIVRADSFTIEPFVRSGEGAPEVDFDPVLLRRPPQANPADVTETADQELRQSSLGVLTEADSQNYRERFRKFKSVRRQQPLAGNTIVVLSKPLADALEVVRDLQEDDNSEARAAFAARPHAVLRECLPDLEDHVLESVFLETSEFSERVLGIGLWEPPTLPFAPTAGQQWLPPEDVIVTIKGEDVPVSKSRIEDLIEKLTFAIENGDDVVEIDGVTVPANEETVRELREFLKDQPPGPDKRSGETSTQPGDAGGPGNDRLSFQIPHNIEELLYRLAERNQRPGLPGHVQGVRSRLFPHQQAGLEWLQDHWLAGSPGVLLADDMGLGKTLQALAFAAWAQRIEEDDRGRSPRPSLVVAPTGLLKNWAAEAKIHLHPDALGPPFEAYGANLQGMKDRRSAVGGSEIQAGAGIPLLRVDALRGHSWVLTTFETVRDYQFSFGRVAWNVVIFDEAQKIKNPAALMTVASKALKAEFVVTMTGTPVENRTEDLWCIVDTCQPGRLGLLREFSRVYGSPDADALRRLQEDVTAVKGRAPGLLLRRLKKDHLEGLPEIEEFVTDARMPTFQAQAYARAVEAGRSTADDRSTMLQTVQALRSISLYPDNAGEVADDQGFIDGSARIREAIRVLDEIHSSGEKALIFLEAKALQPILAGVIHRRYGLETTPMIINGSVSGADRKRRVDVFQSRKGFDVMILSPRAGGVGLTLTAANHVIHLSRWWNPAVESQCTDRVYRIGQERPVSVHVPRAIHPGFGEYSFDVQLDQLLRQKRDLFQRLMAPPDFSDGDFEQLYNGTLGTGETL